MKTFTFYWLDGNKNTLKGNTVQEALILEGYGGALGVLDFYCEGYNHEYKFEDHTWVKI